MSTIVLYGRSDAIRSDVSSTPAITRSVKFRQTASLDFVDRLINTGDEQRMHATLRSRIRISIVSGSVLSSSRCGPGRDHQSKKRWISRYKSESNIVNGTRRW